MNATADLRAEHGGVARMLSVLEVMADRAESGAPIPADDLAEAVDFLRVFVDRCHHGKEEDLLFPALAREGVASVEQTVFVLLEEHEHGRRLVAEIARAADALAEDGSTSCADMAEPAREYAALLRRHIRREEHDCFDVADRELPVAVQDELAEGYERIESDVIGEGRHEAFHALLDRLDVAYPRSA